MGVSTPIEWCDSTINPTTGCDGCELWGLLDKPPLPPRYGGPCYAGNTHEKRLARRMPERYAADFTEVRLAPGRMAEAAGWPDLTGRARPDKPWLDGMPRTIFVGDMGDVLSRGVPFEYLHRELVVAASSAKGSRHVFLMLTKQSKALLAFGAYLAERGVAWPVNLWAGVSLTTPASLGRARDLMLCPAPVRFFSVEPMRAWIDLSEFLPGMVANKARRELCGGARGVDWVIVGGESDQYEYKAQAFEMKWAFRLLAACGEAGVPVFMKQMGSHPVVLEGMRVTFEDRHGGDWSEWPGPLRVRQMPSIPVPAVSGGLF